MYGAGEAVPCKAVNTLQDYRPSLTERLTNERAELATRLEEIDAALNALKAQPEIQKILDLVQKVARF